MNKKEYAKILRIALKFSSKDKKTSSLYNIFDDIFESCRWNENMFQGFFSMWKVDDEEHLTSNFYVSLTADSIGDCSIPMTL